MVKPNPAIGSINAPPPRFQLLNKVALPVRERGGPGIRYPMG